MTDALANALIETAAERDALNRLNNALKASVSSLSMVLAECAAERDTLRRAVRLLGDAGDRMAEQLAEWNQVCWVDDADAAALAAWRELRGDAWPT